MYFGGFRNRRLPDRVSTEVYIFFHLLFLLSVILILEGKNSIPSNKYVISRFLTGVKNMLCKHLIHVF